MTANNIVVIKIFILYSLLFTLLSCNNQIDKFSEKTIFRYNQIGGLESLDPAFAKNLAIMWPVHFIYNTLLEVDSSMNIQPSIADSFHISEDGLIYTFFLKNNVYFHPNELFDHPEERLMTAYDWVYSFDRIIDPTLASPGAWLFNDRVVEASPFMAIDSFTFQIRLREPFAPFLQILTMPYCSVIPKEVVEYHGTDFRNHPCGTGPFKLIKWDEGNRLILHKNEKYWEKDLDGTQLPYLEAIEVSFHESKAMEFLLLMDGKLDFINSIDGSIKDLVLTKSGLLKSDMSDKIQLRKSPYLNTEYIGILNNDSLNTNPFLRHPLIRKSLNRSIDKKKIVTYFRNGIGIPANEGFTPRLMPGMESDSLAYSHYQPDSAAQWIQSLKDSLGWKDITFEIATPESHADMCNFIAKQWQDIGINAKVQVFQPGMLRQMMSQGKVNCFKAQWIADYPDAETYLAYFYGPLPAPPNYTRYNNLEFNNLYKNSMLEIDNNKRYADYNKMDKMIQNDNVIIPLFYDEIIHFLRKEITGFTSNSMNIIDLKRVKK